MTRKRQGASRRPGTEAVQERALKLVPMTGRVEDLVRSVSLARERPIELLPFELTPSEPTGFWVATDKADYVIYPSAATRVERTAVICHELSHMLLDHQAVGEAARLSQLAAVVAPDIDRHVAQRILARHGYGQEAEIEAEMLATRLLARLALYAEQSHIAQDTISSRLR